MKTNRHLDKSISLYLAALFLIVFSSICYKYNRSMTSSRNYSLTKVPVSCKLIFLGFTGTKLLNHVLDLCLKKNILEIYLHVQTNNEDAITFYKKFGFEITDTIQNYYTNITPPDCYVLTKFVAHAHPKK